MSWEIVIGLATVAGVLIGVLQLIQSRRTASGVRARQRNFRPTGKTAIAGPAVEIRIPPTPNLATEQWLEWIHFEVEPSADSQSVAGARAWVTIDGKFHKFMWRTDAGPQEERDLRRGEPDYIPFVARSLADNKILYSNWLQKGVCYITDDQFLVHRSPKTLMPNRAYRVDVEIRPSSGAPVKNSFWMTVPQNGPVTLREDL